MRTAKLYHYQIPMNSGLVLREKTLTQRAGLLLCVQENQRIGWGEIAPLPSFSTETLTQAEQQVRMWIALWEQQQAVELDDYSSSVAFGISCALAELSGELGEQGNTHSALLCVRDLDEFALKLQQCRGEKVAKLKVGRGNAAQDGQVAHRFLSQFPELQLRLDANRGWSLPQAVEFAEQVAIKHRHRIQFIEEPCATPDLSRQFAAQTGIAIAWDETVREPNFYVRSEPNLTACIIKPTLTGSLQKCIRLIEQAHAAGLTAVISSSIESSLGLTQLARFAQQYTPNTTPGLDTLNLMPVQLLRQWANSQLPLANLNSPFIWQI